ncbi:MAG: GTP pyrophosphokinase family protein, partial [Clostridia bacterium]|nr:GTP pyrophosphokinase family protein [Clostridia bacterium]
MSVMYDPEKELITFSEEFQYMLDEYLNLQCRYQAAIRQVQTKLEILNHEFETKHRRNPIHHMENRMKTLQSITEKLHRKNMEVSMNSAVENLYDIAGVRVVCSYIQDVFKISKLLSEQDDISVIRINDYIHHPKPNGYRSLHL